MELGTWPSRSKPGQKAVAFSTEGVGCMAAPQGARNEKWEGAGCPRLTGPVLCCLKLLLGLGDSPRQPAAGHSLHGAPREGLRLGCLTVQGPRCRAAVSATLACGPASLWGEVGDGFVYKFLVCLSFGFPYLFFFF